MLHSGPALPRNTGVAIGVLPDMGDLRARMPHPADRCGETLPVMADWPLISELGPVGALPTAPRLARGFVTVTLSNWGLDDLTDTTELVVSELSANVVRASANPDGSLRYDAEG